jgi:Xaa-Pro aminopeptidase
VTNLERLQKLLVEREIPGMIVSALHNVHWLTGFSGSAGTVFVTPRDALFLTDGRYTLQARDEVKDMESSTTTTERPLAAQIKERAEADGASRLAFEGENLTYANYESWCDKLAPIQLFSVKDVCGELGMVKTPDEIARIREACALTDACFEHVIRKVQVGVRELDISLDIEFFFKRQGAGLAFDPIVVSGERSALPHGTPTEKKLEAGDFVTMDFGAKVKGYCADITRTVVVAKASDRHLEIYDLLLRSQLAAIAEVRPGAAASHVDKVPRDILAEKDLAKYFTHGLGHGLGGIVHAAGRLHVTSETVLEANQVWTIEPGVYIEGFGGARIEDDVLVTEGGCEVLTHSPKELLVVPPYGT